MSTYRKKPVVIEATQWVKNGDHPNDDVGEQIDDFDGGTYSRQEGRVVRYFRHPAPQYEGTKVHEPCGKTWHDHGWIDTLEGGHTVCPGDWIITGVQGELYPIKDSIFRETYEPVETPLRFDPRIPRPRTTAERAELPTAPRDRGNPDPAITQLTMMTMVEKAPAVGSLDAEHGGLEALAYAAAITHRDNRARFLRALGVTP